MVAAIQRWSGVAALVVAMLAFVSAQVGSSRAATEPGGVTAAATPKPKKKRATAPKAIVRTLRTTTSHTVIASSKPRANGVLLLSAERKFPAAAIPTVAAAKKAALASDATKLGGVGAKDYTLQCRSDTVDLGTWCLQSATFSPDSTQVGKTDYLFAVEQCGQEGGWLPSAAELLSAADKVKLASTLDDNVLTASVDEDASNGLKDQAEMSSTLITTTSGGSAAGSEGVTPGAKGDPRQGEPDPIPVPADPSPDTLQYVSVYDNHNLGGFAGGQPVSKAGSFRCGFAKVQGDAAAQVSG